MDDNYLIESIRKGCKSSYKSLFLKYYSPLCEYVLRFVPESYAEDIVSDIFTHLWEQRANIYITESIKSYLFTAAKNRALNKIKANKRHEVAHNIIYNKYQSKFDNPDYYLSTSELSKKITSSVYELNETYKQTFIMSRYEYKTNKEIAEELGISIKTVEYRISQSLKFLRTKLSEYLVVLSLMFINIPI